MCVETINPRGYLGRAGFASGGYGGGTGEVLGPLHGEELRAHAAVGGAGPDRQVHVHKLRPHPKVRPAK